MPIRCVFFAVVGHALCALMRPPLIMYKNSPLQHASLTSHRIWNARILCMSVWDTFYNAFKNYECVISQLDTKTVENHIFFPHSLAIFFPFHLHFLLSFIIGKYLDKKIEMKKKKMWKKNITGNTFCSKYFELVYRLLRPYWFNETDDKINNEIWFLFQFLSLITWI